jgi:hypothetical protein
MVFRLGIIVIVLVLCLTALYVRKKEDWEWNRFLLILSVTVVIVSLFGGILIFAYMRMSVKPEVQTSFWDIHLSNSKSTIQFIKGRPAEIEADGTWIYKSLIHGLPEVFFTKFRGERLWAVGYIPGDKPGGPGIQGIQQASDLDDVIKFFGKPSTVTALKGSQKNIYLYQQYNTFFVVQANKVSIYGIYNPKFGSIDLGETILKKVP